MPEPRDDFYIGYQSQASPTVGRWVRRVVVGLLGLAIVVPAVLASLQGRFSDAHFEFGTVRTFEGRLTVTPYPVLHVDGDNGSEPHLLVEFGKWGARPELEAFDGQRLAVDGQLIYRGDRKMIELTGEAPQESRGETTRVEGERTLGHHQLVGEILDSKCYLGVMKPGRGKTHQDCATRCISGGVPPLFVTSDPDGAQLLLLITGTSGEPIGRELLDRIAEPVSVEGELVERDGLSYLRANAADFIRLGVEGG